MLKSLLEISVVAGTILFGGCGVSTIQYEPYPNDVIRIHTVPHDYAGYYAYAPRPIPRRLYYYDRLWYDEPFTVVIRSNVDRQRVPNSRLTTHFRTAPKRRNVDKEFKEMYRKRNDQLLNKRNEQLLNKRRTSNESTRIKRDPNSNRKVQDSDKRRRTLRTRERPSSGNDKGKNRNRVRIHDGSNRKGRKSSGTHAR